MPFDVYTLPQARQVVRDYLTAKLPSFALAPPNSRGRVIGDANATVAQLNLLFLKWLADNLLPDRAEYDWLLRWAEIYLGGPKAATFASGTGTATGTNGTVLPAGTEMSGGGIVAQTTEDVTLGAGPTTVPIASLTAGAIGNLAADQVLSISAGVPGIDASVTVVAMSGGVDAETEEELRARVLFRIQKSPMGGDADDYVNWSLAYPGVTRAWASPQEQGVGTMTVRVMMDDLRASNSGLPTADDLTGLRAYLDALRPVTVKDFFVEAPVLEPVDFTIGGLQSDDSTTRAAIDASVRAMLADKAAPAHAINGVGQPAQTIYAVWVSEAIMAAAGVDYFDLTMADRVMPNPGNMAVLGTITYA